NSRTSLPPSPLAAYPWPEVASIGHRHSGRSAPWPAGQPRRKAFRGSARCCVVDQSRSIRGTRMAKAVYEIDGRDFSTLEDFYLVVSRVLIPGAKWGHDLDALNDILRGGFGTPEGGFVLRWKNSILSRERLGYPETVRQLERKLTRCHPTNRQSVREELEQARRAVGPTVFDWLVEIIQIHCGGGREQEAGVELILE